MTAATPLPESLASALGAAREARDQVKAVSKILTHKITDQVNAGLLIMDILDIFVEICGAYALLHEMMKICVKVCGVDLQTRVTAATSPEAPQRTASEKTRAFGHILRQMCLSIDIQPATLASRAQLDKNRLQEIASGASEPNLLELFRIATALDVQPSELVRRLEQLEMVPRAISVDVSAGS